MKNKLVLSILLFSFFLISCNRFRHETAGFNQYLSYTFHETIPEAEHTFLLLSSYGCPGCVEKTFLSISEKIKDQPKNKEITILTYDVSLVPTSLSQTVKVQLDANQGYENVGIPIANLAMVKTKNGKIVKIQMINLDNMDMILNEEF